MSEPVGSMFPVIDLKCKKCGDYPVRPFLRGQIFSPLRALFRRPSSAIICWACKEIIGYE